ncbi:MAG: 50S ribosomal protein L4, partial [Actinobacteria bacterium]|nr:50S ribosomal protein L4 [Actinomycetota bacterium]
SSAIAALSALGVDGRVLVVVSPTDDHAIKSFRNLPEVQLLFAGELNAYDVLCNDWIVFTSDVVPVAKAGRKAQANKPMPFTANEGTVA